MTIGTANARDSSIGGGHWEHQQLWIEPVGGIIWARLRGVPTEELIRECQERVLQLVRDTGSGKLLYDGIELELPTVDPALVQQKLESERGVPHWRSGAPS